MVPRRRVVPHVSPGGQRSRSVLVAVALLLGFAIASCGHRGGGTGPTGANPSDVTTPGSVSIAANPVSTGPRLAIFGDSITVISSLRLVKAFGEKYRLSIDARHGVRTAGIEPIIEAAAEVPPDVVVFNLGTNDATCGKKCAELRDVPEFDASLVQRRFVRFYGLFPPSTCVIFVNINAHNPMWGPANAAKLNAFLANFPHVVDWNGAWQPGWFDKQGDPHPNAQGQEALVALIGAQIATCPAPGTTTR